MFWVFKHKGQKLIKEHHIRCDVRQSDIASVDLNRHRTTDILPSIKSPAGSVLSAASS